MTGKMEEANAAPRVAVVIPCLDEAETIAGVVEGFARALPDASIYVFDNDSQDETADRARRAGAVVIPSPRRGKGLVVRHIRDVIDADVYVLVDGDGTYPEDEAPRLVERLLRDPVDMVVATRLDAHAPGSFRLFHKLGNRLISGLISLLFSARVTDVLSGYRALDRELFRTVHLGAQGFEVETELTLQSLAKGFRIGEMPVAYGLRPEGSRSKLNTWSDGFLIARSILLILRDYKPLLFFGSLAALFALASLASGSAPIIDFYRTGLVLHVPRAILAAGLATLAAVSLAIGLILDTIARYHRETVELLRRLPRE